MSDTREPEPQQTPEQGASDQDEQHRSDEAVTPGTPAEQPEENTPAAEGGTEGEPEQRSPELPEELTFRMNPVTLLAALAIAACATPLATTTGPLGLLIYLIPLALAVWILRVRTTIGQQRVKVRHTFTSSTFSWDEVTSLRLDERRWLKAVLDSGEEVSLPAVRVRDLPRVAAMSGGRIPNPIPQE
ncbi:PH domain-containing protein [Saccharopolyspora rectivirgula]|nr:PH domain-containing protein [Saccharopolyspora rectivirgula]